MVDINLKEYMKDGLDFKTIFMEILVISVGLFLANMWSGQIKDVINYFMPPGQGLMMKTLIDVFVTMVLILTVYFAFYITRRREHGNTKSVQGPAV